MRDIKSGFIPPFSLTRHCRAGMQSIMWYTFCKIKQTAFYGPPEIRYQPGGMMNQKDLAYFNTLLNSQLQELQNRMQYSDIRKMTPLNEFQDILDVASVDTDQNMLLRIRERESRLISKIKRALQRISDGTYGVCESCGEDIPVNRLKARPVTTQCINCKMKEEALERVSGT